MRKRIGKRIEPGPGQESVWDYPRPPRCEPVSAHVRVVFAGEVIADSNRSMRVLETSHPPVYYIPPGDVRLEYLEPAHRGATFCEWKGAARYFDVVVETQRALAAAWSYPQPSERFRSIQGFLAFYAESMEACYVADELVQPQPGNFYGGWITSNIVGPFKGSPGTFGW